VCLIEILAYSFSYRAVWVCVCVFEQLMRTAGPIRMYVSAVTYYRVACIYFFCCYSLHNYVFALVFTRFACSSSLSVWMIIWSLALLPAVLLATARASAFHSSVPYRHSTLVLSLLAINYRSVGLIVEWIVVFPLSLGNSTDSWLSAILVIARLIVFGRIFIVLIVCMHSNRAVAAVK